MIVSKPTTDEYREGWDRVYGQPTEAFPYDQGWPVEIAEKAAAAVIAGRREGLKGYSPHMRRYSAGSIASGKPIEACSEPGGLEDVTGDV